MRVILFMPRFHQAVAAGVKTQTIRRTQKRPVKPGESLSLRAWTGGAYRSKQRLLALGVCTSVESVVIYDEVDGFRVEVDGFHVRGEDLDAFARADGFEDAADMSAFWHDVHALPFEGVLIRWEVAR